MGLIERLLGLVFGDGSRALRDTVEVFRENAENGARRSAETQAQVVGQYGAEFAGASKGRFDRTMDALNRLPRPMLALGTLGLFVTAMVDPVWFAERMQGVALVPEPLWWLLGVIVSFYFGARHQAKAQDFQRSIAGTMARVPQVTGNIRTLRGLRTPAPQNAATEDDAALTMETLVPDANPALEAWRRAS